METLPPDEYPEAPPLAAASAPAPSAPAGSLARAQVVEVVDQGLGQFLQRLQVEPEVEAGKFKGFRVLALHPPTFWEGVDLRPGDVVTHVNGESIELPADAFQVFEGLREASEVRVFITRNGEPKQLVYPIVGAPVKNKAGAKSENQG